MPAILAATLAMLAACTTESSSSPSDELVELQAQVAALTERVEAAEEAEAALGQAVIEQTQRADLLAAALAQVEERFPLVAPVDLVAAGVAGDYTASFSESFCAGLPGCGVPPAPGTVQISALQGGLGVSVPGVGTVPVFAANGSLLGVVDSPTAVPPCGDDARTAKVTLSVFGAETSLAADGTSTLTRLGASLVVDAPGVAGCGPVLALYGLDLRPLG